ncbi:hypothetical protein AURDEDRAFT_129756 [Auricularia subglabra TFB-10046 SS5]|uniref:Extracellular membrane protein CFEM domain-containing protein n=1 Tax=Auricularia subglabra (strain TFB-10046 / SS5) TaxID=717982 RepID=J0WVG4_AURST|nr:hypothetical protein AURDEDRAFT_129756 [Auricularia subglabra TFB-10046 SS5]
MRRAFIALSLIAPSVVAASEVLRVLFARGDSGANDPTGACFDSLVQPFLGRFSNLCVNQLSEDASNKCYCENGLVGVLEQAEQTCLPANTPSDDPGPIDAEDAEDSSNYFRVMCAALEKDDSVVVIGGAGGTSPGASSGSGVFTMSTGNAAANGAGNGVGNDTEVPAAESGAGDSPDNSSASDAPSAAGNAVDPSAEEGAGPPTDNSTGSPTDSDSTGNVVSHPKAHADSALLDLRYPVPPIPALNLSKMVNMKLALFAVLAVAATFVAADDVETPANNSTAPGNGTTLDDGAGGNSTLPTNGTATNGTATNGTATNGTETPEPTGGSTRRRREACEYKCPESDRASQPRAMRALLLRTVSDGTLTCTYDSGSCTYSSTGVLISDEDAGQCPGGAPSTVYGCMAGQSNNGGVEKRKLKRGRRSSREIQFDALVKRLGL